MLADNLLRDIKIGLRVLVKERTFCALAVVVLALGISGVTTMFSVVNGVMLRGFSFPNADRMVSLNFVDPSTANFFGVNGQVSAMDFEELLPQQKSFDALTAYLNGSTVNVTVNGHPQRYTGAYVTEQFLRTLGVSPMMGRDFTPADNASGAGKVAIIGYGIWQREFGGAADIVGKGVRINGKSATVVGVMPQRVRVPDQRRDLAAALQRVPAAAAQRSGRDQPRGAWALLKDGVSLDQANAEATTIARRFAAAYPETNKQFNTGQVQHLLDSFTPRPLRGTLLDDARVLRRRAADLVRQRDEHAVRAGHAPRQGAGGALVARRLADAAGAADADREPAGRGHRRDGGDRAGLCLDRLAVGDGAQPRESAAVVDHLRRRRAGRSHSPSPRRWRPRCCPACCRR